MEMQIEEMAKDLCDHYGSSGCDSDNCEGYRYCNVWHDCSTLIEKGYRKASEVAEEIFAEIEEIVIADEYISADDFYKDHPLIAKLKKKYTEGGE